MRMGQFFPTNIYNRGKYYFEKGKVKDLQMTIYGYEATVQGSRPYAVDIELSDDGEPIYMACSCPYAKGGVRCKHMAAVLFAIQDLENKENKQKKHEQPKLIRPFSKTQTEYVYFDLEKMTSDMEFKEDLYLNARKLIEKGSVKLTSVNLGYEYGRRSKEITGTAYGVLSERNQEVQTIISFDKNHIQEARCGIYSCYQSYSYEGYYGKKTLCIHQLAVLLLLEEYLLTHNPGDATDRDGAMLLNRFQNQHAVTVLTSVVSSQNDLMLEPRLEYTFDGLYLSFRIGLGKMFVVKNLTELVDQVSDGASMRFGSSTEISFAQHHFTENAQKYYNYIQRRVKEEQYRTERAINERHYYGNPYSQIKNNILLYGESLDEFFEMVRGQTVELIDKCKSSNQKRRIGFGNKMPEISMQIRKKLGPEKDFQGINVSGKVPEMLEGMHYLYFLEDGILNQVPIKEVQDILPLLEMAEDGKISFQIGRRRMTEFYYSLLPILEKYGTVKRGDHETIAQYLPPEVSFRFYLDAEEDDVTCQVQAVYGEKIESALDVMRKNVPSNLYRDYNRESEILVCAQNIFPEIDLEKDRLHCGGEEEQVYEVISKGIDQLLTLGEVHSTERFRRLNIRKKPKISVGVSLESNLMNLSVLSDDVSMEELLDALKSYRKKKKYYRLKNGDFLDIEQESMEVLYQMMETMHISPKEFVKGKIQIPTYRALYLDKMLEQNESVYTKRDRHFRKLIKEFKTVNDSDYEVPESLQRVLRKYQMTGFKWLRTLEACGFGGILADDMGLGKTLQMISMLLSLKEEGREGTSLIVAPASLVYNWQEELKRFAPQLNVLMITGTQAERRQIIASYQSADVCVTSYDLLKRDIAEYEDHTFLCQILDEAQYIKNHSTAAAKAVKVIRSQTRFALTGTPIENRLSELWSIFDYLMPGFLYSYEVFKKELETPIVKNKEESATERLKKMVAPFILRRLKTDVLKDLPDKLEEVRYAVIESEQKKLYDGQVVHMKKLLGDQNEDEFRKNKIQILAELTRIRQICCDPSLIWEDYHGASAKREACMDLIRSAIEGEHKILVFSQFTSMLGLLEQELTKEKITYYKITGETAKEKRIELVKQFNEDRTQVFLISLKAGGTGLNLTGADVVIHFDPWWNLAVQNQATDRAHRIGQTKIVSVYKLIVRDSIEEKILKMQEQKKNLSDEILSGDLGSISTMSREDFLELLQ